jgi:aspartyl-tRNA(Asn)/glutamyl-tRNA(Gln) amidotransferase subunit A
MVACVQDPGRLRDLAQRIRSRALSPVDLVQHYLDRTEVVQPLVEPWRQVDAERALATADERARQAADGQFLGPLHGLPFGVKDIIDVEGLPTRCNCRALEKSAPAAADAEVVLALKAAGAIVLGKLHTTEFAYFDPSPARNPHNPEHTPGGSSSGSGAAVAAGTVPMALGTQTLASLNRPAAYCGIAAFKPSTRSISGYGVRPLAPSFDTVGFYGWSVDDAVYAYEALMPPGRSPIGMSPALDKARVVFIEDELIADMSADMKSAHLAMLEACEAAGHTVARLPPPFPFKRLVELHRHIMAYEAGRALAHLLDYPPDTVGERIRSLIAEGQGRSTETYLTERAEVMMYQKTFFETFERTDVFLWPATPGPAPKGIGWTGEPKYIAPWTVLGGPIVTLPAGVSDGLPIGCVLSSAPGTDHALGALARRLGE